MIKSRQAKISQLLSVERHKIAVIIYSYLFKVFILCLPPQKNPRQIPMLKTNNIKTGRGEKKQTTKQTITDTITDTDRNTKTCLFIC